MYAIIGAGGFGREVSRVLDYYKIMNVLYVEKEYNPLLKFRDISEITREMEALICIGDPKTRRRIRETYSLNYSYYKHPRANVYSKYRIPGVIICASANVTCDIKLGEHVHINKSAVVGHDCEIGGYTTISPNCSLSGKVKIGEGVFLGSNSVVLAGITIGAGAIVGAGAVVTKDVASGITVVGIPAKEVRKSE